jgi:pimeloyl-ACP methyl ester carboxylesterase
MALDFALAFPGRIRTLTLIEPAAYWLAADEDESARSFHEYLVGCAGRELSDEDLIEFLARAGLGTPGTDFKALAQWDFWSSCRQCLSWGGELATRSAAAGIEGFEHLDVPTLLIRGSSTATWLSSVVDILARGMPDTEVLELRGGHACILERPEEFVAALTTHVADDALHA